MVVANLHCSIALCKLKKLSPPIKKRKTKEKLKASIIVCLSLVFGVNLLIKTEIVVSDESFIGTLCTYIWAVLGTSG